MKGVAFSDKEKLAVAVASMQDTTKTAADLAKEFGMSIQTVRSARKQFSTQARQVMRTRLHVRKQNIDRRGYKGRNGRVELHNKIYRKFGIDADSSKLYEEVNKAGLRRGMQPISKSSFYAMLSVARKMAQH